jgi:hypothetical protein
MRALRACCYIYVDFIKKRCTILLNDRVDEYVDFRSGTNSFNRLKYLKAKKQKFKTGWEMYQIVLK